MSEVKPVIKTAEQRYDEIKGSETFEDRQSLCVMNECLEAEAEELRAVLEALQAELQSSQKELSYVKMAADAEAKFADEYKAKFEALQKENNSLKLGYKAKEAILQEAQKEVAKLRSFDADNKWLKKCNAILTVENAEQAKRIAIYEQFMRTCDKQAAEYELSAQKGTE
jgi:uncharacterized coiled-coil DUF342 family protein